MNEIIANRIKIIKELIAYEEKRFSEVVKEKDTMSAQWYRGCISGLKTGLEYLIQIQSEYEKTEQSINESLDFLRGK